MALWLTDWLSEWETKEGHTVLKKMMKGEKEFLQAAAAVITESSSSITQHVYWHNWTSAMGERRERESRRCHHWTAFQQHSTSQCWTIKSPELIGLRRKMGWWRKEWDTAESRWWKKLFQKKKMSTGNCNLGSNRSNCSKCKNKISPSFLLFNATNKLTHQHSKKYLCRPAAF